MKDNLIDEERAKQEEAAQESLEQKLERLGNFSILKNDVRKLQYFFQISHWKTCRLGFLVWSRNTLVFKPNANKDWLNLKWNYHRRSKSILKIMSKTVETIKNLYVLQFTKAY